MGISGECSISCCEDGCISLQKFDPLHVTAGLGHNKWRRSMVLCCVQSLIWWETSSAGSSSLSTQRRRSQRQ